MRSTVAPITGYSERRDDGPIGSKWLVWWAHDETPDIPRNAHWVADDCPNEAVANLCRGVERIYLQAPSRAYNTATAVFLGVFVAKASVVVVAWELGGPMVGFLVLLTALYL